MIIAVAYEREEGYNSEVCVAVVKNFVCIGFDNNTGFYAEFCEVADIHADYCRVNVDCANDLCAFFIKVADDVFCHFAAAVLYYFYFFHNKYPFCVFLLTLL